MTYDKNGNIKTLSRFGDFDDNITALQIDNLSYVYKQNSNQLTKVTDFSNSKSGFKDDSDGTNDPVDDYSYDANGNMTADENKKIQSIQYNHLNLPTAILFVDGNKINYLYNAVGIKIQKSVIAQAIFVSTEYYSGFQYRQGTLQLFPHADGYVSATAGVYNYVYNYTDHLGNVRLSYGLNPANVLTIFEENNYYPFGMRHSNYNMSARMYYRTGAGNIGFGSQPIVTNNLTYNYKFNGKELQDELGLNLYDYGARNYDPALGRWMNMDKFSEIYAGISPYSYAINNPVLFIDPDGNYVDDSWIYAKGENGKQNKILIKAWETFAKSKEGIKFLSNFAEKDQIIAGHEYKESGKFDQNNHDLNFGLETQGADAQTDTHEKKGGGMETTILLSKTGTKEDMTITDIAHEAFIHAEKDGEDYLGDKKLNLSNLDKDVVKHTDNDIKNGYPRNYRTSSAHHYQEKKDQTLNKRLLPMLKDLYKRQGTKNDEKATKKMINGYTQ